MHNRKQYKVINSCKGSVSAISIMWRILHERNQMPLSEIKFILELPLRYLLFAWSLVSESGVHSYVIYTQIKLLQSSVVYWIRSSTKWKRNSTTNLRWMERVFLWKFSQVIATTIVPLQFLYSSFRSVCKIHSSVHFVQRLVSGFRLVNFLNEMIIIETLRWIS